MNLEIYIKDQVESLEIDQIKKYFEKKYRGMYYVDMKRLIAFSLHSNGLSYCKISKILHGKNSYSCTDKLLQGLNFNYIDECVLFNFQLWIRKNLYPKTTANKRKPQTEYELSLNVKEIHFSDFILVQHGDL
jgi:hypothetical protein